ncbi:MAG: DMT family transporter [Acidobacteria bacterium]|nr:DMT family transporter [Acidobacteriota bacterium]
MRTAILTTLALIAFAANSILCRMALGRAAIDAASFSTLRLVSGAIMLLLLRSLFNRRGAPGAGGAERDRGDWISASMLFLYAVGFSFAYVSLGTGTGALILFGAVQMTMIFSALRSGERPLVLEWIGLTLAVAGLIYLVFPGLSAPSLSGSALMAIAGIAWGIYSLRGRGSVDPLGGTTGNFVRTVPMVIAVSLVMFSHLHISFDGALLAILSGGIASGVGYVIWYAALRGLTATRAATVQLSVPALAAAGGVMFMSESVSFRLTLAGILILGGVGLAVASSGSPLHARQLHVSPPGLRADGQAVDS